MEPDEHASPINDETAFTVQEVIVMELKAAGMSNEAAGAAVDRSAKTVQRLLCRPEARARVRELQAERLDQVVGHLGLAVVDAAQVVRSEMRSERAEIRLRAAALALRGFADLRAAGHQAVIVESLRNKLDELTTSLEQIEESPDA